MVSQFAVRLISLYQRTVSPDHGIWRGALLFGACRFQPTCSEYAKEAIARYGVLQGGLLVLRRIARCHPFGGYGYNPVPHIAQPPGKERS